MSEWQPIETAPKDAMILIFRPYVVQAPGQRDGRVCVGKWNDNRYAKKPRPYWESFFGGIGVQADRDMPPTHWQPLPASPT